MTRVTKITSANIELNHNVWLVNRIPYQWTLKVLCMDIENETCAIFLSPVSEITVMAKWILYRVEIDFKQFNMDWKIFA